MPQELIYTSVPKGLKPGSSGFSTVLHTIGMAPNLIERLENLSGYSYLFPPDSKQAHLNPAVWTHYRLDLAGKTFHVISRNAPYGMDYTGRSNNLAHHIVFRPNEELPACGPAKLLEESMVTKFTGNPRVEEFSRETYFSTPHAAVCTAWEKVTGDAGWAAQLAETALTGQMAAVLFRPGMDVTKLLAEALLLLSEDKRWQVTFSTCFTSLLAGLTCQWRFIPLIPGERAKVPQMARIIDLTKPLGKAPDSPLAELARTGRAQAQAEATPDQTVEEEPDDHGPIFPEKEEEEDEYRLQPLNNNYGLNTTYAPRHPMDLPPSEVGNLYKPKKKRGWIFKGILVIAVVGLLALGGWSMKNTFTNKMAQTNPEDTQEEAEKDPSASQKKTAPKENKKENKVANEQPKDLFVQKAEVQIAAEESNDTEPESDEKIVLIQDVDDITEVSLQEDKGKWIYELEKESVIQVLPQDGQDGVENLKEIPEKDGEYSFNDNPVLKFEGKKKLVFIESAVLDEFLEKYKIVTQAIQYMLDIDGTQIDFESVIDPNGTVVVGDLQALALQGGNFTFNLLELNICKGEKVLLVYQYDDKTKKGEFKQGKDLTKELLQEFCSDCKFVKAEKLRLPVIDSAGKLLALVEDSKTGNAKNPLFKYTIPENCKEDEVQIQNADGPTSDQIKLKRQTDHLVVNGTEKSISGARICFVKKAKEEKPAQPAIEVLTPENIKEPHFWYDLQKMPWLPMFSKIQVEGVFSPNPEDFHLNDQQNEIQNRNGDTVIEIRRDKNKNKQIFQMVKKSDKVKLPPKCKFDFDTEENIFIFFSEPQYGQPKLKIRNNKTETNEERNLDEDHSSKNKASKNEEPIEPEQRLVIFRLDKNNEVVPTIKVTNPDEKAREKKPLVEQAVPFTVTVNGTSVTFESKEKHVLKAQARITPEGKPVLEYHIQDGPWKDNKDDIIKIFQEIDFDWTIWENEHIRSTSMPKQEKKD